MKHWCYYTNVVRCLERVEQLCAPKTQAPAYLVWQDDDGSWMIADPDVNWFRGDGPQPDLDVINISVKNKAMPSPAVNRAVTAGKRSASARPNRETPHKISSEWSCTTK